MILVIDVKKENILQNERGRIVVKLDFDTPRARGAYMYTTDGDTLADLGRNMPKSSKVLSVGWKGGISLE
jgi:hypothetical protein